MCCFPFSPPSALPLSIIHSSSQVVFIEWLRMHQLLSSAGLWPTPVSVLACLVHPLLFHLFFHLLLLILFIVLLHLLPVDRVVYPCISFRDGTTKIVDTHSSPFLPVFLIFFFYPTLSSACLSVLPFLYDFGSLCLTPPFLSYLQHVSTCLLSSLVSTASSEAETFFLQHPWLFCHGVLRLLIHHAWVALSSKSFKFLKNARLCC